VRVVPDDRALEVRRSDAGCPVTWIAPWYQRQREYHRSAEWGTAAVARVKFAAGEAWSAEDYADLMPPMPDLSTHATRQRSVVHIRDWRTGDVTYICLGDMTVDAILFQQGKLRPDRTAFDEAWHTAYDQELDYRAQVSAYETQTHGRYDGAG